MNTIQVAVLRSGSMVCGLDLWSSHKLYRAHLNQRPGSIINFDP